MFIARLPSACRRRRREMCTDTRALGPCSSPVFCDVGTGGRKKKRETSAMLAWVKKGRRGNEHSRLHRCGCLSPVVRVVNEVEDEEPPFGRIVGMGGRKQDVETWVEETEDKETSIACLQNLEGKNGNEFPVIHGVGGLGRSEGNKQSFPVAHGIVIGVRGKDKETSVSLIFVVFPQSSTLRDVYAPLTLHSQF